MPPPDAIDDDVVLANPPEWMLRMPEFDQLKHAVRAVSLIAAALSRTNRTGIMRLRDIAGIMESQGMLMRRRQYFGGNQRVMDDPHSIRRFGLASPNHVAMTVERRERLINYIDGVVFNTNC